MDDYVTSTLAAVRSHLTPLQEEFHQYQTALFIARSPQFFALELCGEAGELANLEKKRWKGAEIEIDSLADEAADVCIALMNYCNSADINLADAVIKKLQRIPPTKSSP